jgi:alcohol dehydrogenase class IV
MNMLLPKSPRVKSKKLTDSAKHQECTLRLPGICNHDCETTVAAHLPGHIRGMAMKENDLHTVHACCACHDVIDGRHLSHGLSETIILDAMIRALSETQARYIQAGLLIVKGAK